MKNRERALRNVDWWKVVRQNFHPWKIPDDYSRFYTYICFPKSHFSRRQTDGNLISLLISKPYSSKFCPQRTLPWHNFRCHPVWCANHCISLSFVWTKLSTETKICEFDCTNHTKQNIVTFDVPVNDATIMKKFQSLETLFTNSCNLAFFHNGLCDNICERATIQILERDKKEKNKKAVDGKMPWFRPKGWICNGVCLRTGLFEDRNNGFLTFWKLAIWS